MSGPLAPGLLRASVSLQSNVFGFAVSLASREANKIGASVAVKNVLRLFRNVEPGGATLGHFLSVALSAWIGGRKPLDVIVWTDELHGGKVAFKIDERCG